MDTNTKVRIIRNQMRKFADAQEEAFEMFSLMDGSGECGKFFWDDEDRRKENFIDHLLNRLQITKDEYIAELNSIIRIEEKFLNKSNFPYDVIPTAYNDLYICS